MENKTIDTPYTPKRKAMRVTCIKDLRNPAIKVGNEYVAGRNAFGMYVSYPGGKHVMPDNIFRECFTITI